MIWQLVKRDPAWRNALIGMAIAAVVCAVFKAGIVGSFFGGFIGMAWMTSRPYMRTSPFLAALPISSSDLFLARLLSLLSAVWLPILVATAVLRLSGKIAFDTVTPIQIGAALSVVVLAVQSSRVPEIAGSQWAPAIAIGVVVGAGWPLSRFMPPAALLLAAALVCAVLFGIIWRQIPPSFQLLSHELQSATPVTYTKAQATAALSVEPRTDGISAWLLISKTLLSSLFPGKQWIFWPLIVLQFFGGQWVTASMFALIPIPGALVQTSWARSLPLRRGAILAIILVPWILPLLLNVLLNAMFISPHHTAIQFDDPVNGASSIRVPLEFWRIAPDGRAPIIESPWHESWQAPIEPYAGFAIYNPYGMGPRNSRRFFEWQFSRATLAIYGEPVPFADSRRLTSLRPVTSQTRFVLLDLAACACWFFVVTNAFLATMHWRTTPALGLGQTAMGWIVAVPVLGLIQADMMTAKPHGAGPLSATLLNALLLHLSAALPDGLTAVFLAAILPVALLSWSAVRLFEGAESPSTPATPRT